MINIPIVLFIILIACATPLILTLIIWAVMSIVGSIQRNHTNRKMKKHEEELNKSIHIVLTRNKDEEINND